MDDMKMIIMRLKKELSVASDKQLADKLGISQQDFSNRKIRGTLLPFITETALKHKINLNWLLSDEREYDLNTELLEFIIQRIEENIQQKNYKLNSNKKAKAISYLYKILCKDLEGYNEITETGKVVSLNMVVKKKIDESFEFSNTISK